MNLGSLRNGAILAGVMVGGGAVLGAGAGAVQSLNQKPTPGAEGLNRMERRSVGANMIVGGLAGAVGGLALLGAKKLVSIPVLKSMPLPALLALGAGTGAATYGAYTLGRNAFN